MASVSPAVILTVIDEKSVEVLQKHEVHSSPPNQLDAESLPKSSQSDLALPVLIHNVHESPPTPDNCISILKERVYLATLCWCMFLMGWGAGSLGPLLPTIQLHYKIDYTLLSMLFVAQCCGTIPGALFSGYLNDRLGFGKVIALGASFQLVTYASLSAAPPFPLFCVIFAINGLASALQLASCNIFIASLSRNGPTNLGILHASFCAGALTSPLVATQFAQHRFWSFNFLITLGLAIVNNILVILVFRWKRQEDLIHFFGDQTMVDEKQPSSINKTSTKSASTKLKEVVRLRSLQFMLLFIFIYYGAEITIGGWIVTYLQRHRGGGASAGYVSSGFFGGMMLGRVALLPLNRRIGPERTVFVYSIIAIGLELVVWLVPSLIGDAIAISFVGMFIGPFYPIIIGVASRKLPKELLGNSIGLISATGQVGAAIFPFVNGALASKFGMQAMQPLIVSMLAALTLLWIPVARCPVHASK